MQVRVRVGPYLKYLDLTLDGKWSFAGHLAEVARREDSRPHIGAHSPERERAEW